MITGIKAVEAYQLNHPAPWDDIDEALMDNLEDGFCMYNPETDEFKVTNLGELCIAKVQGNA